MSATERVTYAFNCRTRFFVHAFLYNRLVIPGAFKWPKNSDIRASKKLAIMALTNLVTFKSPNMKYFLKISKTL